jgi:hypothetical protein
VFCRPELANHRRRHKRDEKPENRDDNQQFDEREATCLIATRSTFPLASHDTQTSQKILSGQCGRHAAQWQGLSTKHVSYSAPRIALSMLSQKSQQRFMQCDAK